MRLVVALVVPALVAASPLAARAQAAGNGPALVAAQPRAAEPLETRRYFTIASAILGETRRVGIALPASYTTSSPAHRYPVAVILDGESLLGTAATVSAELASKGHIPELVVVAIENTRRLRDLTPPGLSVSGSSTREGGDRFLDFIERELLPAVDRELRTSAPRVLVGHSSGGILATYAAATRPAFRAVVALDTPIELGDRWLVQRLLARARRDTSALRYAALDARFDWPAPAWKSLTAAAPRAWSLSHEHLAHESHTSMPFLGMYLGLRQVFADYSPLAAPQSPTTSIVPYYAKVGASLGASVAPPRPLLRDVIDDLVAEGRGAQARATYDMLVRAYGAPANAAELEREIARVERLPPPTETVESLLATPFPSAEAMRPWLGEWVGDNWISDDEPRSGAQRLRIRVVNGRVEGETVHRTVSGTELVQKWTYLRITPQGLTFGYMNGMRPRGMLLFEGTRRGDTLAGDIRFGGITARGPEGEQLPTIHFSYRRVRRGG